MRQRRSDARTRRYGLIVCLALAATLGLGLLLTTKRDLPALLLARASPERAVTATPGIEARTASIVLEPQGGRCRDLVFNNDTGEIAERARPCEASVAVDDKGVPLPVGTLRRLDAISKSFLKK
jgi:hypothetical protein